MTAPGANEAQGVGWLVPLPAGPVAGCFPVDFAAWCDQGMSGQDLDAARSQLLLRHLARYHRAPTGEPPLMLVSLIESILASLSPLLRLFHDPDSPVLTARYYSGTLSATNDPGPWQQDSHAQAIAGFLMMVSDTEGETGACLEFSRVDDPKTQALPNHRYRAKPMATLILYNPNDIRYQYRFTPPAPGQTVYRVQGLIGGVPPAC